MSASSSAPIMVPSSLEIAVTCSAPDAAERLGPVLRGIAYTDARPGASKLPFRSLVTGVTDNLPQLETDGDVGAYVICRRTIKPGAAQYYGLFPMLRHPEKSHETCDAHWRDVHGPLALEHHAHMTHYVQLSVVQTLRGPEIDGFALCGFATEDDLRNRFFTTPESVQIIADDIENFAHTKASPRRLIAQPSSYEV
ncbi:MAG: EthD domain-containing protein [Pseudomonadota bacterium]